MLDLEQRIQELSEELECLKLEHSAEIIQRNNSEKLLKDMLREQRQLVAHFFDNREKERKAVSWEIQEGLGQMLASIQLNVSLMTMGYNDHQHLVAQAKKVEQLITSTMLTVQRISAELRPVMLDHLGLAEAIDWQVKTFEKKTGIFCKAIILLLEKKVASGVATAIYRILEEALANINRHSGATHVRVDLVERNGWLTMWVRDNGLGVTEKESPDYKPLNVATMREWALVLGGKMRICGAPRLGTALIVRIPLALKENEHANQNTDS